ncbi:MAG: FHA domain-containing protein [Chloroflexi bacterium]|nr:FHA domain-containing protein [Ktedonobacteraceae bacterium]MBV9707999.1 FHA domain-containing protein [Chloroflexota bacterium]
MLEYNESQFVGVLPWEECPSQIGWQLVNTVVGEAIGYENAHATPTTRGVNFMKALLLLMFIGLPSLFSLPIVIIASLVLVLVIVLGAVLLFRNSGKKATKPVNGSGGGEWQRQPQQNAPGAWNPQGGMPEGGWAQQAQMQQMQQPGGWGPPPTQGQQYNGWGGPNVPQQQQNSWATQSPGQQQQANSWASQAPAQQPAWGPQNAAVQQPAAGTWGNQGWDAASSGAQQQDGWGQQQGAAQSGAVPWGTAASAQQGQPPQQYGVNSGQGWGQPGYGAGQPAATDGWGASAAAQQYPGMGFPATPAPAAGWQQAGMGQVGAGPRQPQQDASPLYSNNDDRTMLRSPDMQSGLGVVRVEEGKEPGRAYEIRKDTLSIGRSRESDIFLEDLAVSRLHASIVNVGNGNYGLKDEGSANGTRVNGQMLSKHQTVPLQEGDKIQLGQTVLVFARR